MLIAFTYEILSVDPQSRVMEIIYKSPGRQDQHVGARLPYTGEHLEDIIQAFSPIAYWTEMDATIFLPEVGTKGEYTPPGLEPTTLGSAKQSKKQEIAGWRYLKEIGGVVVNNVRIKTDRESQATINGAYTSIKNGLINSVDWKSEDGTFVSIGLTEVSAIAQAVAEHVQESFTAEKDLALQVEIASTIEEVQAIVVPWPWKVA